MTKANPEQPRPLSKLAREERGTDAIEDRSRAARDRAACDAHLEDLI
jgi:hypothetical protein